MHPQTAPRGLHLFRPPYDSYEPIDTHWAPEPLDPGAAVVWFMAPTGAVYGEMEWLWARPRSLPFFLVLPEPEDVPPLASILRSVPDLGPRGVLPCVATGTMDSFRLVGRAGGDSPIPSDILPAGLIGSVLPAAVTSGHGQGS